MSTVKRTGVDGSPTDNLNNSATAPASTEDVSQFNEALNADAGTGGSGGGLFKTINQQLNALQNQLKALLEAAAAGADNAAKIEDVQQRIDDLQAQLSDDTQESTMMFMAQELYRQVTDPPKVYEDDENQN